MKELSVRSIASRAWDLACDHWPIFLLLSFLQGIISSLGVRNNSYELIEIMQNGEKVDSSMLTGLIGISPIWGPVSFLLSCYVGLVTYRYLSNATLTGRTEAPEGKSVWRINFSSFAFYAAIQVLFVACVGFGLVLCLIPGIILFIRWEFALLIAATENVGVDEAFRRSWRLTKNHFWKLLLMNLSFIPITILGLMCCCEGELFTSIMIQFMIVVAYYMLASDSESSEYGSSTC